MSRPLLSRGPHHFTTPLIGSVRRQIGFAMPVDNPDVVDAIGIERATDIVVLTISDHLAWDSDDTHLRTLQAKINRYIAFIERGEIFESYPPAIGRPLRIDVVCKYPPSRSAERFLAEARTVIEEAGWSFSWHLLESD